MRLSLRVALGFLAGFALAVRADDPKATGKGKTDPPGVPLAAALASKPASYTLDLGGKTADEIRKQISASDYPAPPTVDLNLELRNTGDKDVLVRMGGTTTTIDLDLQGPAAVSVALKGRITNHLAVAPKTITLAPGRSQTIPINSLTFGFKDSHAAYWLAPGKYTLTASYKTTVSPAPAKSVTADEGFGVVTIVSAPLTITVEGK
jgi:hypothetical protein